MAGNTFSAGVVAVDVVPDTSRFYAELKARLRELRDLKVPVNFDPDDALATRTYERWNGREAKVNVSYDVDMSGLRALSKQDEKLRRQYERPFRPLFDDSGLVDGLNRAIDRSKRLDAVQRKVGETFSKSNGVFGRTETTRLKQQMLLLDQCTAKLDRARADRNELAAARADEWADLNRQILGNMSTLERLRREYDALGERMAKTASYRDMLRSEGRRDDAKAQTARLRELRSEYRAYGRNIREVTVETNRLAKRQDGLKSDSIAKWIHNLDKQIVDLGSHADTVRRTFNSIARESSQAPSGKTNILSGTSVLGRDWSRRMTAARKEQERLNDSWREGDELSGNLLKGTAAYSRNLKAASNVMASYRNGLKDANRLLDEQESQLKGLQDALHGVNRYGRYSEINRQLNDQLAATRRIRKQLEANPTKTKLVLDDSQFNRKYGNVTHQVRELTDKLERENELNIRVKFWEDTADSLEERLNRLRHKRISIPVDIRVDNENLIARAREMAEKVRANPDRKVELEADLDLDMKHAEERIKEFKKKNDELNMDVDLETAAARAHLDYFTRPRTIDIFAKFHGTDIGKILSGMTYGASGLKGVENQFQNLVTLMDSLDSKVPKFALLGSAFTSLGAGATNLAGSVGGVGKSLISLSKAAYAAPAALTGLGAVFASFKMIYGDKGKTWSNQIDFANTKLSQLSQNVQDAFYGKAKPAIMDTANVIGDSLVPEMSTLAKHEGEIVSGMMDAVRASYRMNELPQTFDYVNESLDNLVPGVNSLITALSKVGAAGGKYLPQFANWVSRNATLFAEWGDAVLKDSDRVDKAVSGVKEQAGYLGSSVKSLKGIFEGTFGTLAYYENGIEGMSATLASMDKAVNSVRFQQVMKYWISGAQVAQSEVRSAFSQVGDSAYRLRNSVKVAFADAGVVVGSTLSNVSRLLGDSRTGLTEVANGIASGWRKAFDEIGNSGNVFSELLSMAGSLSNAFGGTFAASLKAAAPLIKTIAEAAGSVADAFDKLPAPIKGALGLWMTFGRAGKSAWMALKSGALENIQSTMQYQNTLRQLGVTIDGTKTKIGQLVAAMAQLSRNAKAAELSGDAAMYGNVAGMFMSSAKGMKEMSSEAEKAAVSVAKTGAEARLAAEGAVLLGTNASHAGSGLKEVGDKAEPTRGKLSKLKTAAKDTGTVLWDMAGGFSGVAGMAGIGAVTVAFSDYAQHAQNVEQVSQDVANAISSISSASVNASSSLGSVGSAIQKSLMTNPDAGRTAWQSSFLGKASTGSVFGDFKDASDSINRLNKGLRTNKVNMTDMSKAVSGTNGEYQKFLKQLNAANSELNGPNVGVIESIRNGDSVRAYEDVTKRAAELRKEVIKEAEATAVANGYSKSYVQTLLKKGASLDDVAIATQSATQLEENHASAEKMFSESVAKSQSSLISMNAAGSSYNSTLASMGDVCKNVQQLMSQGQGAWDSQKKNFDLTTEAGREASNAFGILSSNAQSYISAMIDHGASLDEVTAKNNEMRQSIYDTAMQMFNNKDIAQALQDQYALTPTEVQTEFKAHVRQAKLDCMEYLNLLRDEFITGGKQKEYDIIMKAITSGAITDIGQVQMAVDAVLKGASARDVEIILQAKDGASDKIKNAKSLAEGFGLTKAEINILAKDEAGPKLDAVKQKLRDSGLTDAQIQILIDALDKASGKMKDIEKQKVPAAKGVKFDIDATDNASPKIESAEQRANGFNGHVFTATLDGNPNPFNSAMSVVNATQLLPHSSILDGNPNLFNMVVSVVNATQLNGHSANIDGNPSPFWNTVNGIPYTVRNNVISVAARKDYERELPADGSVVRTVYMSVVKKESTAKAATGGRIYGPGTGTSDSIPAWLSNGEAVLKASSLRKLDAKYGRGFFNTLNATGDVPAGSRIAKASNTALAYRRQSQAYAAGVRVQGSTNGMFEVNMVNDNRELVSAVNDLRREVEDFRDGIGGEISRNSSPWPSKRDFVRDVLEASRGR